MADLDSVSSLELGGSFPLNKNLGSVGGAGLGGTFPLVSTRFLSSVSSLELGGNFPTGLTGISSLEFGGVFPLISTRTITSVSLAELGGVFPTAPIIKLLSDGLLDSTALGMTTVVVLVLNSSGVLTSTITLSKLQVLSLLSALSASTTLALSATYRLSLLSNLSASSLQSLQSLLGAELPDDAAVWVVNLDTNASAQYDNYGFNSFFQRGQDYFGVAADGVYKLTGDTDSGVPIDAFAAFIRSSLGIQSVKHIPTAYIGATSDGGLVLRADVDGIARYYKARTSSTTLQQHRLDLGRGARGVYWEFELMNQNGDDFDIADVTLLPVALDRRI